MMNRFAFLLSTLGFYLCIMPNLLAQENVALCQDSACSIASVNITTSRNTIASKNFDSPLAYGTLTEAKWKAIARRYYQSRLRTNFNSHNDLLSLWDVKKLMGFSGIKVRESSAGNRQYWVWIDRNNPYRKIKATFNYYQLVDLKGVAFESVAADFIKAESVRSDASEKQSNKRYINY